MRQGRGGDCRGKAEQSEERQGGREGAAEHLQRSERGEEKKERGRVKGQGQKWRMRTGVGGSAFITHQGLVL